MIWVYKTTRSFNMRPPRPLGVFHHLASKYLKPWGFVNLSKKPCLYHNQKMDNKVPIGRKILPPNALLRIPLPIFVENNRNSRKMSWERKEGKLAMGQRWPPIPWDREYPPRVQEKRGPGRSGVTKRDSERQSIQDSGLWKALLLWEKECTEEWGRTGLGVIGKVSKTGQLMALWHPHWWKF